MYAMGTYFCAFENLDFMGTEIKHNGNCKFPHSEVMLNWMIQHHYMYMHIMYIVHCFELDSPLIKKKEVQKSGVVSRLGVQF